MILIERVFPWKSEGNCLVRKCGNPALPVAFGAKTIPRTRLSRSPARVMRAGNGFGDASSRRVTRLRRQEGGDCEVLKRSARHYVQQVRKAVLRGDSHLALFSGGVNTRVSSSLPYTR